MHQIVTQLLTIKHPDEDMRRRGRLVVMLSLASIVIRLIAILLPQKFSTIPMVEIIIVIVIGSVLHIIVILLAQRGQIISGGFSLIGLTILGILLSVKNLGTSLDTSYFL